jgi:hypothetical protein
MDILSSVLELCQSSQVASKKSRATVATTARLLWCTRHIIDRVARDFIAGGILAVGQLKWGSGRPMKFHSYSLVVMDMAVSKKTLIVGGPHLEAKSSPTLEDDGQVDLGAAAEKILPWQRRHHRQTHLRRLPQRTPSLESLPKP